MMKATLCQELLQEARDFQLQPEHQSYVSFTGVLEGGCVARNGGSVLHGGGGEELLQEARDFQLQPEHQSYVSFPGA